MTYDQAESRPSLGSITESSIPLVLEFGNYRLFVKSGSTKRAIVSAASLGTQVSDTSESIVMIREWRSTFERLDLSDHIIYVQDITRSWFNSDVGWADLIAFLRRYFEAHGIREKICLGLSMGATGAIILDRDIKFDRVVAMAPQILIGLDRCSWDVRYKTHWQSIDNLRYPNVAEVLRPDGNCTILFSVDVMEDIRHVHEVVTHDRNVKIFITRGDHNIGVEMKTRNVTEEFISALLADDMENKLADLGVQEAEFELIEDLNKLVSQGIETASDSEIKKLYVERPAKFPRFLFRAFHDFSVNTVLAKGGTYRDVAEIMYPVHAAQIIETYEMELFAVSGWSPPDHGFMWSEGIHHFVRFSVVDLEKYPKTKVILRLLPLLSDNHLAQRIRIYMNGKVAFDSTARFGSPEGVGFEVALPVTARACELHIITPDCVSPLALGTNNDNRLLAFSLNYMALVRH